MTTALEGGEALP